MVLAGRQEEGRRLDPAEIDRHAAQRDAARLHQQVLLVHVAQIEAVHQCRHAGGIAVPIQQVEGEGVLAQQVVVHHERPDQVVGAQHVEGGRHGRPFQIALLVHLGFQRGELFLVDEHGQFAGLGEVGHGGEEGGAVDALVLFHIHVGEGGGEQGAAQAIADDVGLLLAGRLLDGVQRGQRAFEHVVLEGLVGMGLAGIDPGDDEHRQPLFHGPFDEAVLRPQIEDVILVDPGRDDQKRSGVDLLRRRRVLDQLHQVVLVDHRARRGGDVLADREGLGVGHLDRQLALAALQILQQVVQALHQVLAAGLDGGAQHLRIGHDEVGRRHRVDELAGIEIHLLGGLVVQPVDLAHRRLHPARRQQVGLLDVVEQGVLVPGGVGEAAVAALWADDRLGLLAHHPLGGALPQGHIVLPQGHLGLHDHGRVGHHLGRHLQEGIAHIQRVE